MIHRLTEPTFSVRGLALLTSLALVVAQLALPDVAEASHLGSSTTSAGSAPSPAATLVENFQPDLFTGRATTSIPIVVPPGRKGIQPNVALAYSSSSRNGWLGMGWLLDVGYIERSTKNGVPKYDSSDTFTFMFHGIASDLVQITDGTYRAENEGLFLKVMNNGVSGWEVRDKSGTKYFFGQTTASQIENTGQVFRWALDKVLDPNGNTLTVTYTKDQNQLYPAQINYTGHDPTSLAPSNQVTFTLESRPDNEVSYRSGFAVTTAKRLKEIAAYATVSGQPNQLARKYVLAYTTSARTGRSLISSVQQVGTDGTTSLPATTFAYQDSGAASYPSVLTNSQSPPSVAAWNIRKANLDTGHENWGCAFPYSGLPWGSPIVATGGFDLGCLSGSVGGTGDLSMSGCNDHFGHAWTYVYVSSPRTLSLSFYNSNDVESCLYREDASGVTQMSSGSIPLQAGWSLLHLTAYHQHQDWGPTHLEGGLKNQVDVMNSSQIPLGVPQLAGDADGNGTSDLIKFNPSDGSWTVSCSTSCTLLPTGTWIASGFGNSSSTPLVGDWNGDGKTDIAIYSGGSWQFATSTGSSFQTGTPASTSLGSGTPLTGDFNGDGITDIGTYNNGSWSIALGTGSGFTSAGGFSLSWGDSNYEGLTGDFNGDGLTDIGIVNKSTGAIDVRLSTGSGWTAATNWIGSFGGNNPHTSADFNGDGLTDAVYYNRSAGQVLYAPSTGSGFGAPITLPVTFSLTSSNDTIQVGDFNGDGMADPAVFNLLSGSSQLALSSLTNGDGSNGTATDALKTVNNGLGGSTTIHYQPSTQCMSNQALPFVVHVVQSATASDGLGHDYTTNYLFTSGLYDAPTKEFRGFAKAKVFDAEGNKTVTEFHQDLHKKGRPFRLEFRDASDNLWTKTEHTWSCTDPYPGVHFARLDQTDTFTYDGDASFKQARSRFQYDSYGNVTRTDEDGDVSVTGDERSTVTSYITNDTAWIVNRPKLIQTLDQTQAVVAQRRFYYDGATGLDTPPTTGKLTKMEEWLNLPTPRWLGTTLTYDPYGNASAVTDPLTHTTSFTYDAATHTYLSVVTNAAGHTQSLTYDPRFGQVLTSTDPNNVTTTTVYDMLGRVSQVIGPNDTASLPTISYQYDVSTIPSKTTTQARLQSGQSQVFTTYTFTDGLGRTIQTRRPAEDPTKQVVAGGVEFDTRGLVSKQWLPYFSNFSPSYVPVSSEPNWTSLPKVTSTYDPVRRLVTVTDPDNSVTATSYSDWTMTTTDSLGHQTRRTQDAYGRLASVEEFNQTQTYTTTYAYDALNNLTTVTDHAGNSTHVTYDSLSRQLAIDEPDMHHWSYTYDDVDNLTGQIDARGVTVNLTYDALSRPTQKTYTIPQGSGITNPGAVTYTYDDSQQLFAKGEVIGVTDGSGSASFQYDNLGRVISETKTISGTPRTITSTYDLLDRPLTLTYPNTQVATYTYNLQGATETVSLQVPGSGTQSLVTGMDYNAVGQLTHLAYGNGATTDYTYNPLTLQLNQLQSTGPSGTFQNFTYTADPVGNITNIVDAVAGHAATQTFQYDALNRLTQAVGSYGSANYTYDAVGNLTSKAGVTRTYGQNGAGPHALTSTSDGWTLQYDQTGNLIQKTPAVSALESQLLSYDAENQVSQINTAQQQTVTLHFEPGYNFFSLPVIPNNNQISALFPTFAQDLEWIGHFNAAYNDPYVGHYQFYVGHPKFDDFTTLDYGKGYQLYCKNPSGLTVQITGKTPTTPYSINVLPEWHLLPAIALDPKTPSWLLQGVNYDQIWRWNATTQHLDPATQILPGEAYFVHIVTTSLFAPSLPTNQTTTLVYDGAGGVVKRTTAAGTTTYLGDDVEIAPDGTTTNYVFVDGTRIAASDSAGATRFYHTDHLGSSNVITNATGQVTQLLEYDPHGAVVTNTGTTNVAHKFTGQRQDAANGLVLFPARPYDPSTGQFCQADSLVGDPSTPQFLNRYSYVRGNPVNRIDPDGQCELLCQFIIFLAAWAAGAGLHYALFNPGFNPTILQDTGERFLDTTTPPPIPPAQQGFPGTLTHAGTAVGHFTADALFDAQQFSDATALLRVGTTPEKILALTAMGVYTADVGLNLASFGAKAGVEGALKVGGKELAERGLARSAVVSSEQAERLLLKSGRSAGEAKSFIGSFEGPITARIAESGETFGRFTGKAKSEGSFLTKNTFASPAEAKQALGLEKFPNPATLRQNVTTTGRSIVLEGGIKDGGKGVKQSLVVDKSKFRFGRGKRF